MLDSEYYDIALSEWLPCGKLPEGTFSNSVVCNGDRVFSLMGSTGKRTNNNMIRVISTPYREDMSLSEWTVQVIAFPFRIYCQVHCQFISNDIILLSGGVSRNRLEYKLERNDKIFFLDINAF